LELIIEASIEVLEEKQKIFQEIEKVTSNKCIFSSNTSTIDIDKIGELTTSQNRILGLHFFSPAHIMKLLEVVKTKYVDDQVLLDCLEFGKKIFKTCIVVLNKPVFLIFNF
jgi:enoyl-CoA hydratase/3-hydroxyacyl-CoA dehydrogenase